MGQTLLTHSALVRVNVCCSLESNRFADKSRLGRDVALYYTTINGVSKLLSPTPKLSMFAHLEKEPLIKTAIWFAVVPSSCLPEFPPPRTFF
jgi:hypothetical protein